MTVFEKTDRFLRNLYETAFYFAVMAVKENFRNYVGRAGTVGAPKPSVLILGNGPSLAEDLPRLIARGEHTAKDVMAVNYFALDERFTTVRPAYYVLSGSDVFPRQRLPRPCGGTLPHACRKGDVADEPLRAVLQPRAVRLPCRAAQPQYPHRAVPHAGLPRVPGRGVLALPPRSGKRQFRDRGAGVRVCRPALLGYKTLELYGVDHTALDGLSVDDENRLCRADRHYYDDTRPFRSRSSRRFRTVPIRWPFIWPRSPNCSAATRRCAIMPDRSGRGS